MERQIVRQTELIAETSATLKMLKDHLLGNGHPGRLAEHEQKINALVEWRAGSVAQMRLLKVLGGLISIPGIIEAWKLLHG